MLNILNKAKNRFKYGSEAFLSQSNLDISSSAISSVYYNKEDESLVVYFKRGGKYKYFNVTPAEYHQLIARKSVGKEFVSAFRNNHEFAKLS